MAVVWIPSLLRPLADGADKVTVLGATLREIIENLDRRHPGFRDRLLERAALRPEVVLAIGNEETSDLNAPVGDATEVHILPAVSGGSRAPGATRSQLRRSPPFFRAREP
jgi:molybdopterin converting factor small subunit